MCAPESFFVKPNVTLYFCLYSVLPLKFNSGLNSKYPIPAIGILPKLLKSSKSSLLISEKLNCPLTLTDKLKSALTVRAWSAIFTFCEITISAILISILIEFPAGNSIFLLSFTLFLADFDLLLCVEEPSTISYPSAGTKSFASTSKTVCISTFSTAEPSVDSVALIVMLSAFTITFFATYTSGISLE